MELRVRELTAFLGCLYININASWETEAYDEAI
jgi:hypothetical protein